MDDILTDDELSELKAKLTAARTALEREEGLRSRATRYHLDRALSLCEEILGSRERNGPQPALERVWTDALRESLRPFYSGSGG